MRFIKLHDERQVRSKLFRYVGLDALIRSLNLFALKSNSGLFSVPVEY